MFPYTINLLYVIIVTLVCFPILVGNGKFLNKCDLNDLIDVVGNGKFLNECDI